jgi:SAM-dependent methyltransferase
LEIFLPTANDKILVKITTKLPRVEIHWFCALLNRGTVTSQGPNVYPGGFMTEPHFIPEVDDDFVKLHEEILVPAIYAQWAHRVVELAEINLGSNVLEVACGTGVLAGEAQLETGLKGKVTGLDYSEKMLEVARRKSGMIEWIHGDATDLPFKTNRFDRVMCQFSLTSIANRVHTIKEMLRVCKPSGLVVLAVWSSLDHTNAYKILIELVRKHAGAHAASKVSAPWSLGGSGFMDALLLSAGVNEYECHQRVGQACYPSRRAFIDTHLQVAGERRGLDKETYKNILSDADTQLQPFMSPQGQLITALDANIFVLMDG